MITARPTLAENVYWVRQQRANIALLPYVVSADIFAGQDTYGWPPEEIPWTQKQNGFFAVGPVQYYSTVPSILGLTAAQITSLLTPLSLIGRQTGTGYSAYPAGQAFFQAPSAGAQAPHGSYVSYTLSLGPNPPVITDAPNVVGQYYYDAQLAILDASFLIQPPTFVVSSTVLPGYVISQSVAPGTPNAGQTPISITVSAFRVIPATLALEIANAPINLIAGGAGVSATVEVLEPAAATPLTYQWDMINGAIITQAQYDLITQSGLELVTDGTAGNGITITNEKTATATFSAVGGAVSGIASCTVIDNWGAIGTIYVGISVH